MDYPATKHPQTVYAAVSKAVFSKTLFRYAKIEISSFSHHQILLITWLTFKNAKTGDFLGGPVVNTLPSNAGGMGSIPGPGAKIPYASKKQNIKQKQYCNKFNEDFKNCPH